MFDIVTANEEGHHKLAALVKAGEHGMRAEHVDEQLDRAVSLPELASKLSASINFHFFSFCVCVRCV